MACKFTTEGAGRRGVISSIPCSTSATSGVNANMSNTKTIYSMKKLLLLSCLTLLFSTNTRAQNWFAADHRWMYHISGGFAGFDVDIEMTADSDTTIKNLPCRKWRFQSSGIYNIAPQYTYTNGPRAYMYLAQLDSFVKMYDFSLQVGDVLEVPKDYGVFTYQIDAIDVVQAGGLSLKRQRVHYIDPNGQPSSWKFDILENIGMVGQPFDVNYPTCGFVLLPNEECGSVVDGIDISFVCFSSAAGSFSPFIGQCFLVDTNTPDQVGFQVTPNPATNYVDIQPDGNMTIQAVQLMDVQGKNVCQWNGDVRQVSLQGVPTGVYLLEVTFSNGARTTKKIVKGN